ncbi:DUF5672 family protein [Polynucleobacter sp. es-EL-1]|uniref:DUF5672 family protein n=1 Tax=Polynucleobacter sp. es-EL-1 TaxID=1855652 RepID=UPI001BFED806|nr:DUF5672 family protein [Polynucleobacter sp. es-EL-1]QWE10357.1 hypothetical protein FD974_08435 [Polynucleobacter sp. es-EL-1]
MKRNIGAVIIDTYQDKKMPLLAIEHISKLDFINQIYFLSDSAIDSQATNIKIPKINSAKEYSDIVLFGLMEYIREDYILIFQWDGFSTHPESWIANFLNYDYVGAPIYLPNGEIWIGNGGFSLRSRRLLELTLKLKSEILEISADEPAEDQIICTHAKKILENHGTIFAPIDTAAQFSYQNAPQRNISFGFHGVHNFPFFLSEDVLLSVNREIFLRAAHPQFIIEFFANCIQQGMIDLFRSCLINFSKNDNLYKALLWDKKRNPNSNLLDFIVRNNVVPIN